MNYTTVEQSKKLLELGLNPETADMWWTPLNWQLTEYYVEVKQDGISTPKKPIPCWSLGALLQSAPKYFSEANHQFVQSIEYDHIIEEYCFRYKDYQHGGHSKNIKNNKDLFDGVYNMVVWLLENGYIKKEE